ncbi:hypothetical protein [Corynebacterium striatum]
MNAFEYAQLEDSMDYLYDFFDQDLESRVRTEREYLPESLQDLLGDHTVLDYIWLWIKEPGPNGFKQYLRDGEYSEAEVEEAFLWLFRF